MRLAIVLMLTLVACDKGEEKKVDPGAASATASTASAAPSASVAPVASAEPALDDVPSEEDFEDEAENEITAANLETQLAALKKEIEGN